MAVARVVTFDGVSKQRMDEMKQEMEEGGRPDEVPATEIVVLHDPDAERSVVILFFDSEDDYTRGDEALNASCASCIWWKRTSNRACESLTVLATRFSARARIRWQLCAPRCNCQRLSGGSGGFGAPAREFTAERLSNARDACSARRSTSLPA